MTHAINLSFLFLRCFVLFVLFVLFVVVVVVVFVEFVLGDPVCPVGAIVAVCFVFCFVLRRCSSPGARCAAAAAAALPGTIGCPFQRRPVALAR